MIPVPSNVRVWLATGHTDMRKGFDGLSALVQTQLAEDPFSGQLFVFRGRAGDRVKILWWNLCCTGYCTSLAFFVCHVVMIAERS